MNEGIRSREAGPPEVLGVADGARVKALVDLVEKTESERLTRSCIDTLRISIQADQGARKLYAWAHLLGYGLGGCGTFIACLAYAYSTIWG